MLCTSKPRYTGRFKKIRSYSNHKDRGETRTKTKEWYWMLAPHTSVTLLTLPKNNWLLRQQLHPMEECSWHLGSYNKTPCWMRKESSITRWFLQYPMRPRTLSRSIRITQIKIIAPIRAYYLKTIIKWQVRVKWQVRNSASFTKKLRKVSMILIESCTPL
jgi:hypothetical protein